MEIASKRLLEAVFVIDIDEKYLQEVTCHTYVPVIFLECILEKEFFFNNIFVNLLILKIQYFQL